MKFILIVVLICNSLITSEMELFFLQTWTRVAYGPAIPNVEKAHGHLALVKEPPGPNQGRPMTDASCTNEGQGAGLPFSVVPTALYLVSLGFPRVDILLFLSIKKHF